MSIQNILQQLLASAQSMASGTGIDASTSAKKNDFSVKTFAGGALSGGALGLLMGNKKFRKMGGKVAAYGGAAALGALALRAYQDWQNKTLTPEQGKVEAPASISPLPVTAPQVEQQSRTILVAMIAAAKADGHLSAQEQSLLDKEFSQLQASATEHQWLQSQLAQPADPAAVAALVTSPEEGAQVYLASVLISGADNFMERAYLDELARQLKLDQSFQQHLETLALEQ
ncbi:tellurite resistance TerB family protein [Alcaligenes endophyticus]|uniref:Tellurite resistance TerB family protein n=1 Tax=Alcaligenes endophyticus TaxID=1929088 RepID=A0ABT8EJ49_9BURK|nr:tellurite resistance TerB family protein [Alcaligenes endophyticus]MCX5591631.1 tellurite resistance TerB family protein [Alcaligenes endophyticus]MDN4121308.1 tellurite resistance TerB family protein [Alcaligenes endophyticus]